MVHHEQALGPVGDTHVVHVSLWMIVLRISKVPVHLCHHGTSQSVQATLHVYSSINIHTTST
jgi:hypothetical protein